MTHPNPQRHVVPTAVLTKSKLVPFTAARPVTTVVPHNNVTRPRPTKTVVTKPHSPPRRNIHHRPSPKHSTFPQKVTTVKAPKVNVVKRNLQHALKDKGVIDSGCSRHMTGNMSYMSDFEKINGGYVAFGGNSKGGKITGKGKIRTGKLDFDDVYFVNELKFNLFSVSKMCDKKNNVLFTETKCIVLSPEFKLLDENQVLLRVPRENNMYNVDLKNIVPSRDLTCLSAKATLDESNLWHRRLGHINFKTMINWLKNKPHNKTPYELLLGRTHSTRFMRLFGCHVTILNILDPLGKFDGKADEGFFVGYSNTDDDATFEFKEPEFEGKKPESEVHVSPSSSAKTKKHDDKTKREAKGKSHVNAASTPVPPFGQISTNSTNTFSVAGPSNTAVSPTLEKSSYVDTSQYPDDLNMPALEDITYSDDKEDVGAWLTLLIWKQLSQSMTSMVKDQGFEDPDYPDKVYEVVKAIYGLHQDPRAWYETLANYLLENGFQRGKIDRTLFIKKKKASTPIDTEKPLLKDPDVKRIFRYLKGKPHLGLWYLNNSPFNLVAYSNSDYAGASLDRKSATGGCQFLGCRLISWKKVIITDVIVKETLRLDDAKSIYCLPNEEIFKELSRMGYKKPSTKLTFYKAFFLAQWKFLIHTIL
nr:ribonuclease H-like domain-containing protein [Tanacetum cinerariifolium]